MKKKTVALLLALVLTFGVAVGGTIAWLTDTTEKITNTFTTSDIDIDLDETTGNEYQMIPGYTIGKDPIVTVKASSEKCWLFVKLVKSANFDQYMTYEMADGWTELTGVAGVYYRAVEDTDADQTFAVLKGNQVSVKDTVTKAMMETAKTNQPTLTVSAYASQYMKNNTESFTEVEAWGVLKPTT